MDEDIIEIRKKDFEHIKNVAFGLGCTAGVLGLLFIQFVWLWVINVIK